MKSTTGRSGSLRCLVAALITLPLAACASAFAGNASGTYVGKSANEAFLLQLVQTDNGQLSGRYEKVTMGADGKLLDIPSSVVGAISGETISLIIKPVGLFGLSFPASGTLRWGHLQLNLAASQIRDFQRSDVASFRKQVAQLTAQGSKIVAEQARLAAAEAQREASQRQAQQDELAAQQKAQLDANRLAQLQGVTQRINDFVVKADALLPKFPTAEQSIRDFTNRMRRGLNREESIVGNGQASVARGQLSVAINQVSIQANQAHIDIQNMLQAVSNTAGPLLQEAASAEQACSDKAHANQDKWDEACGHFIGADKGLRDRISALKAGFEAVEGIWATERSNQEQIVQSSNRAVG